MPLSEHEQRLLDEIEQALYQEDPKFASSVRSARTRSRTRSTVTGCVFGVIVGLALVVIGLLVPVIALAVVGFVLVVGSAGYAVQILRGNTGSITPDNAAGAERRTTTVPKHSGLRSRMEDRLRKRFEDNS